MTAITNFVAILLNRLLKMRPASLLISERRARCTKVAKLVRTTQ